MDSDLLARWTATITNIAIVIGLVFVGLEFRSTTKAIEADRIDSITQAIMDGNQLLLQTEGLPEILFKSYASPEELTPIEEDKLISYMYVNYTQFRQVHQTYLAGLFPEDQWQSQKATIGFGFSSDVGIEYLDILRASAMDSDTLDVIHQSALSARDYCKSPDNLCTGRFETPFRTTEAR
jgi:hypothetical protein